MSKERLLIPTQDVHAVSAERKNTALIQG
jgi:hypothetical protein